MALNSTVPRPSLKAEPERCGGFRRLSRALLAYTVVLALGGCASRGGGVTAREEVFGFSRESRPIRGVVLGSGPETLLLCGVIHGDEPLGKPLLERFVEHARETPLLTAGKRLVVIPVLNPDGLVHGTRENAAGVDLNRNFPARNWKPGPANGPAPASEPETRALVQVIRQFQPRRILAIHSPLRLVNYDGPAEELAREMARVSGYSVAGSVGYPTPGSLGCWAGIDWKTPTITLELGRDVTRETVWHRFHRALGVFIVYPRVSLLPAPTAPPAKEMN